MASVSPADPARPALFVEDEDTHERWELPQRDLIFVDDLRVFCQALSRYKRHEVLGARFLALWWVDRWLADDCELFSSARERAQRAPGALIYPKPFDGVTVRIESPFFAVPITSPSLDSVRDVRHQFANLFNLPCGDVSFTSGQKPVDDSCQLSNLSSYKLTLAPLRAHFPLVCFWRSTPCHIFLHLTATAFDLACFLQVRLFIKSEELREISVSVAGRVLGPDDVVSRAIQGAAGRVQGDERRELSGECESIPFSFESGHTITRFFPIAASLNFARIFIALEMRVPFGSIEVWSGDHPMSGADLKRSLGDFSAPEEKLLLKAPLVTLQFADGTAVLPLRDVPLSHRIHDVKKKFCSEFKGDPATVQFGVDGRRCRDEQFLGEIGVDSNTVIIVTRLKVPYCHLRFSNLEGQTHSRRYLLDKPVCFADVAKELADDPRLIEFQYMSHCLKPSDPINKLYWDPAEFIMIFQPDLTQPIQFEGFDDRDAQIPISGTSTVADLISGVREKYPDIRSFALFLGPRQLRNEIVLDINPDLDPLVAKSVQFNASVTYPFRSGRQVIPLTLPEKATCKTAKEALSEHVPAPFQITFQGRPVADSDVLVLGQEYQVESGWRTLIVTLVPSAHKPGKLAQRKAFDARKTVADVVAGISLGDPRKVIFRCDGRPVSPQASIATLPDGADLTVEYPSPQFPGVYQFSYKGTRMPVQVDTATVSAIKYRLLNALKRAKTLPGVLGMKFWDCELAGSVLFSAYGIPPSNVVEVSDQETTGASLVDSLGRSVTYYFGRGDDVKRLKAFMASGRKFSQADVILRHSGAELDDSKSLSDFAPPEFQFAIRLRIKSGSETQTIELPPDATVQAAVAGIAAKCSVPPERVRLSAGAPDASVWELVNPSYQIIPGPPAYPNDNEKMQAQTTYDVSISLDSTVIAAKCSLPPTATVADLVGELRKKRTLPAEVEVVLASLMGDPVRLLRNEVRVGDIDIADGFLIIQRPGTFEMRAQASASVETNADAEGEPAVAPALTGSLRSPLRRSARTEYSFYIVDEDLEFKLGFMSGETVLDTKKKIVEKFGLEAVADVNLLFSGKTLRDGFVMERLRIGKQRVVVHVTDHTPFLIYTAQGRRQEWRGSKK